MTMQIIRRNWSAPGVRHIYERQVAFALVVPTFFKGTRLVGSKTRRGDSAREKDRNEGVHMKPPWNQTLAHRWNSALRRDRNVLCDVKDSMLSSSTWFNDVVEISGSHLVNRVRSLLCRSQAAGGAVVKKTKM